MTCDRREFLRRIAAGGVAMLGLNGRSRAVTGQAPRPDWRLGWRSVTRDELPPLRMEVEGHIPRGLRGTLLRNGPARFERGDRRYGHWFDGDGMLQRFHISDAGIEHRGRFIETERYLREREAGTILHDGAGTFFPDAKPPRNNDTINVANTALQPWGDHVLALWEGGSAHAVDPESLATREVVTWREDLAHAPFSAHPLLEPDGRMWNFGFAPYAAGNGALLIYLIDRTAGLSKLELVKLPFAGYMHDFAMSARHLVFLVPPYHYARPEGRTFVDRFLWEPQRGSRLLVLDKADLSRQRWFDLPPGFVFHFAYAAEAGPTLRIHLSWYDDPSLMSRGMREVLVSGLESQPARARISTIVADLETGRASLEKSDTDLEFPVFDERSPAVDRVVYGAGTGADSTTGAADSLTAWSPGAGEIGTYRYAFGTRAEEALLVADAGSDGHWLLQTALDCLRGETRLSIFDADKVAAGPVAVARMPRALPLGFHGTFLSAA